MIPIFNLPKKFSHFVLAMLLVFPFSLLLAFISGSTTSPESPSSRDLLTGIFIVPFFETLLFQFTFGTLIKVFPEYRVNWLIFASAFLFAAMHMIVPDRPLLSFPITFWQGVVLQVAFIRFGPTLRRATFMTFAIHSVNNSIFYLIAYAADTF